MKRGVVKIVALLVILILAMNTIVMAANSTSALQSEKNKTNQQINEKKEELQGVKTEKTDVQNQVSNLNDQISNYQVEIDELDSKIDGLETQITEAQGNLTKAQEDYTNQEKLLKERLIATYEAGQTSYLEVILSSKSLTDFISNYYLVTQIANNDKALMEKIVEQKKEIEKSKKTLEDSKNELDTSKTSKESKQNQLEVTKKEKDKYVTQLSASEKELEKQLEELRAHENSVSNKIKEMQAAYDRAHSNKNSGGTSSTGGTQTNGSTSSYGFGWPVKNPVITTEYGSGGSLWASGRHTGVDFQASTGTPVFSIGDGVVVDVQHGDKSYGNYVEIYHGNNIYSFYAHASSTSVSINQNVSKGQQIMLSGATGNVTGPHLHFEIRTPGSRYANCVNPRPYLP